ncbi:MAG: DMT family transporter [Chloroflexota bacterium]
MRRWVPPVALLSVTAAWGWTFVVVHDAIVLYPVVPFLALRFGLAATIMSPALWGGTEGFRAGLLPGCLLCASYFFQTEGLRFTTASKAGLLTGLFVVFTPIVIVLTTKVRPRTRTVLAILAAFGGTVLLAGRGPGPGGHDEMIGIMLEILTAITLSAHILLLGRVSVDTNPARVALGQMVVAASVFGGVSVASGGFSLPDSSVWQALLITGVFASALAFWIQTAVQQRISPSRTAIILVAEPAFATFFGVLLAHDSFTAMQAAGALLIFGALFFHELAPSLYGTGSDKATTS